MEARPQSSVLPDPRLKLNLAQRTGVHRGCGTFQGEDRGWNPWLGEAPTANLMDTNCMQFNPPVSMEFEGPILEVFETDSPCEGPTVPGLIPAADSSQWAAVSGLEKHHPDLYLHPQAILPVCLPEHSFYKTASQTGWGTASLSHGLNWTN